MPKIGNRIERLEKLDPYRGRRPTGMSTEDFFEYWRRLPLSQVHECLSAMSAEELDESISYLRGLVAAEEEQQHGNS